MAKVSIIIPVYNSEKYLKKCLDSVCNQSLEDIEIIILNDASTDNSLDIIKAYEKSDSRIKVINMERNLGPGGLRNIGIQIANGKYIGFVDSDDYIEHDMYSVMYQKMIQNDVDMVICGFISEICNIDYKKILGKSNNVLENDSILIPQQDPQLISEKSVNCWNKLYRHDFIEKFSFPEDLKFEDYPMGINMLGSANQIFSMQRSLYHYRIRPNSLTTSDEKAFNSNTLDIFTCNEQIRKFYLENGIFTIFEDSLNKVFLLHSVQKLIPMLSISMPFSKKKKLINYYTNLLDIEFDNWKENEFFQATRKSSIRLGTCMSIIEKLFLDDSMRQEISREIVKQKIIDLCDIKN